jgi:hypothetical protein
VRRREFITALVDWAGVAFLVRYINSTLQDKMLLV